jgi:putative transcriptional regulator
MGEQPEYGSRPLFQKREDTMPIKYDKLLALLNERGYTSYKIRKENLMGQGTLTAIKNGTGGLDAKTLARLCKVLNCQPGDIMEYTREGEDAQ